MTDHPEHKKGSIANTAAIIAAYQASPEVKARTARAFEALRSMAGAEARQRDLQTRIVDARAAERAAALAERRAIDDRHRQLVEALERAGAHSWRRDIAIAALGAFFGAVATLLVGFLT
jgi:hypothetical protein